ncbi:IS66 family insertion sequence element accessory protein TnpB [Limosilactobacillus reuteri]|uniref:IS66 family insertion sequence element accessory protein TnpB n=1 Tax=Limosilactobacillus reuteri TaxID=1598 RepID=UPI003F1EFA50
MLVNWHDPDHIYLVCGKTDMRKGIDGLAMVIAENYGLELYNNSLFLFWALCPVKYTDQIDKNFRRLDCGIVPRSSRFCLCKRVWY